MPVTRIPGTNAPQGGAGDQTNRIKRILEREAITAEQLAERTGIPRPTIERRLAELRDEGRLIVGLLEGERRYTLREEEEG